MPDNQTHRVRIKLPSGAELEAEGSPEFVYRERAEFMGKQGRSSAADFEETGTGPHIVWDAITEVKGHNVQLRAKLPGDKSEKDACLILLAASDKLLSLPRPTAAQLAKWLRISGYPITRVDRALHDGVAKGEILSAGSRRARRYELTTPGRLKAYILASQLTTLITGRP